MVGYKTEKSAINTAETLTRTVQLGDGSWVAIGETFGDGDSVVYLPRKRVYASELPQDTLTYIRRWA